MSPRSYILGISLLAIVFAVAARAQSLPQVSLNADNLGPRPIEQLTGTNITRNYSMAWHAMALALEQNRTNLLNDQFTGFAKDHLSERITDQQRNGVHVQIVDKGHHVKALFYSLDGGAMQLVDDAQIDVQVFDGSRLIYSDDAPHRYLVLMTPGTDRWYVRYLERASDTGR